MTAAASRQPVAVAFAVMAALGAATAVALGLTVLARPAQFETRLAQLRQDGAEARKLLSAPAASAASASADCGPASGAPDHLRSQLIGLAARAQVSPTEIAIRPLEARGLLRAFQVSFQGDGSNEAAVALLAASANLRPTLFFDTVDLKSRVSSATLEFKGRVYCEARR